MTEGTELDVDAFGALRRELLEAVNRAEEDARTHAAEIVRRAEARAREIEDEAQRRAAALDEQLESLEQRIQETREVLRGLRPPMHEADGAEPPANSEGGQEAGGTESWAQPFA